MAPVCPFWLPVCLSLCLSVSLSIPLSLGRSICVSPCLSVDLPVCLSIFLSVCLPPCLSVCLSLCRSAGTFALAPGDRTTIHVSYTIEGEDTNRAEYHDTYPPPSATTPKTAVRTAALTWPPALNLGQPRTHEATRLHDASPGFAAVGGGGGGVGGGGDLAGDGTRRRAYRATSAGAAGARGSEFLRPTISSRAEEVEVRAWVRGCVRLYFLECSVRAALKSPRCLVRHACWC